MNTKFILQSRPARYVLCATFLAMLVGCIVEPVPRRVYVEPAPGTVLVADDYIYYPDYEVYYNPYTQLYWYTEGGAWVSGPIVPGITVDVLLRAPSVRLSFHDSVANHHAMVARRYPRGWRPPPR